MVRFVPGALVKQCVALVDCSNECGTHHHYVSIISTVYTILYTASCCVPRHVASELVKLPEESANWGYTRQCPPQNLPQAPRRNPHHQLEEVFCKQQWQTVAPVPGNGRHSIGTKGESRVTSRCRPTGPTRIHRHWGGLTDWAAHSSVGQHTRLSFDT